MKTLLLLRHAKSSWKEPLDDYQRPLNQRGMRDAPRMGRLLYQQRLIPDLMISSSARRAERTAAMVAEHCKYPNDVRYTQDLYHGGPETMVEVLNRYGDPHDCVMLVGHNPAMEQLLHGLTGIDVHFATAAIAQVELDLSSWRQLDMSSTGTLVNFWRPSQIEP